MARTIHSRSHTNDLHILERPNARGYSLQQGSSHILLSFDEAEELADALADLIGQRSRPGKARLLRYVTKPSSSACPCHAAPQED